MKHYVVEIMFECEANSVEQAREIFFRRFAGAPLGGCHVAVRLSEWQLSQDDYEQSRKGQHERH